MVRAKVQLRKKGNRCVFTEAQKSESGSEGHSTGWVSMVSPVLMKISEKLLQRATDELGW